MPRFLNPLKKEPKARAIFGFDVETLPTRKNKFLLARITGPGVSKLFWNKHAMAEWIMTNAKIFKNSYLCATNLGFDTLASIPGTKLERFFFPVFRGSEMIFARLRFGRHTIKFIDSMNFLKCSVKSLGEIIGLPKIETPAYIKDGRMPYLHEYNEIIKYNERDTKITESFMAWLQAELLKIGASMEITAASTAMKLYRRRFMKQSMFREPLERIEFLLKAYYGGRTEVIKRGPFTGPVYAYDVNSMYPYVMLSAYPDVNSSKETGVINMRLIELYEGVSDVDIEAPYMPLPYLPYRDDTGKLMFPYGTFRGCYTHYELRKALSLGYVIKEIHKTVYYTRTHEPFKEYVNELYALRMKLKSQNGAAEKVAKLLLNSLYGKWGERPRIMQDVISLDAAKPEDFTIGSRVSGKWLIKNGELRIPQHSMPIYAIYTTAYARTYLWELAKDADVYYMDTDSIVTKNMLHTGTGLGELKLEKTITRGCFVRPKLYSIHAEKDYTKAKGCPPVKKMAYDAFLEFLKSPSVKYMRFSKFRESLKRGLSFNEEMSVPKSLGLEDDKRAWPADFSLETMQESGPLQVIDGIIDNKRVILLEKAMAAFTKQREKEWDEFCASDAFDSFAVGHDVSYREFLETEMKGVFND